MLPPISGPCQITQFISVPVCASGQTKPNKLLLAVIRPTRGEGLALGLGRVQYFIRRDYPSVTLKIGIARAQETAVSVLRSRAAVTDR
jgi:hypothetical protein